MTKQLDLNAERDDVYIIAEANANVFNIKFLAILAITAAGSVLLNDVGIFTVERKIIIPVMLTAMVCFLIPFLIYIFCPEHITFLKSEKVDIPCIYVG